MNRTIFETIVLYLNVWRGDADAIAKVAKEELWQKMEFDPRYRLQQSATWWDSGTGR